MVTDDQNVKPSAIEIIGSNTVNVGQSIHLDVKVKPVNTANKEVPFRELIMPLQRRKVMW